MQVFRNTLTGSLYVFEAGDTFPWPSDQTEDISSHPVISRQLAELWRNDKNGFCTLTDSEFSAAELASIPASLS